ncbi:MAG TPA: response regulator [Burkholderiales bacterium]|jgi:DNA-binding NarL/FixJ family response regulator
MGQIRVAIADDSPTFLAAAADYVAGLPGYVLVGTAPHASQALALVRHAAPDVLLLDLGSAPARGFDALREVNAFAGAPAIVAMTLFHSPETAAAARRAGAAGLVGKDAFVSGLNHVLAALFPARAA